MRYPLDSTLYAKDPGSQSISASIPDGGYAYVRDVSGIVNVVPDGPHVHPKILGGGQAALYAGDMTIRRGRVVDLTHLSGTFQFDEEDGLREVAAEIQRQGLQIDPGAVRFFPPDGSSPVVLQ